MSLDHYQKRHDGKGAEVFGFPICKRQRSPKKMLMSIVFSLLTMLVYGQSTGSHMDEGIYPTGSEADNIGGSTEIPFVNVNEFTGKVRVSLPTMGVDELSLTPHHKNSGLFDGTTGVGRPSPINNSLGKGWSFHLGYIETRRVSHLGAEKVGYINSRGELTTFEIDNLFQDHQAQTSPSILQSLCSECGAVTNCLCYHNFRDSHWIDGNLRRITRQIWSKPGQSNENRLDFAEGEMLMMEPNGTLTYFEPVLETVNTYRATYVPYRVVYADGREITITYVGMNGGTPMLATIEDSWGRRLRVAYQNNLPQEVFLEKGSETVSLGTFSYTQVSTSQGPVTTLREMKTPEGYTYRVDYDSLGKPFPFVTKVTLPTGGDVRVEYDEILFKAIRARPQSVPNGWCNPFDSICQDDWRYQSVSSMQLRVSKLHFAGTTHQFTYQQKERTSGGAYARLKVTVTTTGETSAPSLAKPVQTLVRESTYFAPPFLYELGPYHPLLFSSKAGLLESEKTTLTVTALKGFTGSTTETNAYEVTRHLEYQNGGLLGAPPVGDSSYMPPRQELVWKETVTENGISKVTEYKYDTITPPGAPGPVYLGKKSIKRYMANNPEVYEEQTYRYDHIYYPLENHEEDVFLDPEKRLYFLGMGLEAKTIQFENSQSQIVKHSLTTFTEPVFYGGEFVAPKVRVVQAYRGPNEIIATQKEYYGIDIPGNEPFGRLAVSRTHDKVTRYENYMYDRATKIIPEVDEAATVSVPNIFGLTVRETKHGVTHLFEYDGDNRVVKEIDATGLTADLTHTYSPNGQNWHETRQGEAFMRTTGDAWGRELEVTQLLEDAESGPWYKTLTTDYDDLGRLSLEINPMGGKRYTEYDHRNRPVRIRAVGDDQITQTFTYKLLADGGEAVTTRRWVSGQDKGIVVYSESDFFGRITKEFSLLTTNYQVSDPQVLAAGHQVIKNHTWITNGRFAGFLGSTTLPDGGLPRWRVYDWLGNLRAEYHPEMDLNTTTIPSVGDSSSMDGITRYVYDGNNRLVQKQGANNTYTHDYFHDVFGRVIEVRDQTGRVLERYNYDDAGAFNLLSKSRDGVMTEYGDFDALNRARESKITIPEPLPAPGNLSPDGVVTQSDNLKFSWQDSVYHRYILEFKSGDLPAIPFSDIVGVKNLTLSRQVFDQRLVYLHQEGVITASERDAYRALYRGNSFFDALAENQWRVRGITFDGEPGWWSSWISIQGNFDCAVSFDVNNEGTVPVVSWSVEACLEGLNTRILVSSSEGSGSCTLQDTLWLSGGLQGSASASWMSEPFSVGGDNQLLTEGDQCAAVQTSRMRLQVLNSSGEEVYLSDPLDAVRNTSGFQLVVDDLSFGAQPSPMTKELLVRVEGASSSHPAQVNLSVQNDQSGAFSVSPTSLTITNNTSYSVTVGYDPKSTGGDAADLVLTIPGGPITVSRLSGRLLEETCDGNLYTTTPEYDFGVTIVGDAQASKSWEGRVWNETMQSCLTIESYQIQYLEGNGGLSLTNAGNLPVRLSGLEEWRPHFVFSPNVPGKVRAVVTFLDHNHQSVAIQVEGEGVNPGRFLVAESSQTPPVAIGSHHFGDLRVGVEGRMTLYVHNAGGITQGFTAGVSGSGFSTNSSSVPLNPGQSTPIWIDIRPTEEGIQRGVLSIYPQDSSTPVVQVSLSVNGTRSPAFTVSPGGPTDLGEIFLSTSGWQGKTVTNTSGAVLSNIVVRAGEGFESFNIGPGDLGPFAVGERKYPTVSVGNVPNLGGFVGEVCYDAYDVSNLLIDTQCEVMYGTVKSFMDYVAMETERIAAVPNEQGAYAGAGFLKLGRLRQKALIRVTLEDPNPGDENQFSFEEDAFVPSKEFWFDSSWTTVMVYKHLQVFFKGNTPGDHACTVKVKVLEAAGQDLRSQNDVTQTSFLVHAMPTEDLDVTVTFDNNIEGGWKFDQYLPSTPYRRKVYMRNNMAYPVYMEVSVDYSQSPSDLVPFIYTPDGTLSADHYDHLKWKDRVWMLVPANSQRSVPFYFNSDFAVYDEDIEPPSNPFEESKPGFPSSFSTYVNVRPMGSGDSTWLKQQWLCLVSPYHLGQIECVSPL